MLNNGILYIAAAGAGKTTKIINDAINNINQKCLILTYTNMNYEGIKNKIKEKTGLIPTHIEIQTWFSFLLKHGIRPYQGFLFNKRIKNIEFKNSQTLTWKKKTDPQYYVKNELVYSDKLSSCVIYLNDLCNGKIFSRLSKIYDCIYIDEIQDLAGYDLEILKKIMENKIKLIMVGDPRQCTYTTHNETKYKKYSNGKIDCFFQKECKKLNIVIDELSLNKTYRNNQAICEFANKLYPNKSTTEWIYPTKDTTCGVYLITKKDLDKYLCKYSPIQLRYNKNTKVNTNYKAYNFGQAKGEEFERILIYPTKKIWDWIVDQKHLLPENTKSKFYVGITRASQSVAILRMGNEEVDIIPEFKFHNI